MALLLKSTVSFAVHLILVLVIIIIFLKTCNSKRQPFSAKNKNFIVVSSIRCDTFDQNYIKVNQCILKAVNRTHKYFLASAVLLKSWEKPIMLHFRVLKRANGGFKPFGIDVTLEGCKYMEGKKNPAIDWFFEMNFKHSNINHTCPYVEKYNVVFNVPVKQLQYPSVFPDGIYRFDFEFSTEGKVRVGVYTVLELKEL